MSTTTIYTIGEGHVESLGSTRNAWLSAMYVWNQIAKDYFGLEHFPISDEKMQRRVWNAFNEHDLSYDELIVLSSTMDRACVKAIDKDRLVSAFRLYAKKHPDSTIGAQADIIEGASIEADLKIAWNQTSCGNFCFEVEYDENDEPIYPSIASAWDLFEQYESIIKSKESND